MSGESVAVVRRNPLGQSIAGVTSAAIKSIQNIQQGAMIRAFPTSAGTASVYSSGSPAALCAADIAAGAAAITGNTNARWSLWAPGAVTADTVQQALMPQSFVVIIAASGTWTLEVCQP